MYNKSTLRNGIEIVSHSMPRMQSVALGIWIRVGGRYEDEKIKGVSHYLEHMLFKGSRKYSCRKIKETIEGVGGSLNGFTSEELTCYLAKLPHRYLETALDILSDMVINPLLSRQDIDKERTVILEEIKMYKDLPQSYVHDLLDELMWPGQPLGMSILGTVESVSRIDRNLLSMFKGKFYAPRNIVISASGKLAHDEFCSRCDRIFSGLKEREKSLFLGARKIQDKPNLKVFVKETEQTHMALGFHGFSRDHPLKYAVSLLHIILGANMSSRLFNELREKRGLAYEIGTQIKRFRDAGAFVVNAGIDNTRVKDALRLIMVEISKLTHNLVTESELERAKEFYLGQLMLALEDTLDYMLWIGESTAALDKVYSYDQIARHVNALKRSDIREAARRIFRQDSLNLAMVSPLKNAEELVYRELSIK